MFGEFCKQLCSWKQQEVELNGTASNGKEFEQDSSHRMVGLTIMPLLRRWTSWLMRSRSSRVETILTGQMYCTRAMWRCRAYAPLCFPLCCFKKLHMLPRNCGPCRVAKIAYVQKGKKREQIRTVSQLCWRCQVANLAGHRRGILFWESW